MEGVRCSKKNPGGGTPEISWLSEKEKKREERKRMGWCAREEGDRVKPEAKAAASLACLRGESVDAGWCCCCSTSVLYCMLTWVVGWTDAACLFVLFVRSTVLFFLFHPLIFFVVHL